jgi:hypothetical protein
MTIKKKGYREFKEEALDRTVWRARFGRGYGPFVRQQDKLMNVWVNVVIVRVLLGHTVLSR